MTAAPGLAAFVSAGVLKGDHGGVLEQTPLLKDVIEAYCGSFHQRTFVSPRRQGKSTAIAVLSAFELLCVPGSFVVWVSGSGDQAADILEQKLRRPLAQSDLLGSTKLQLSRDRLLNPDLGSVVQVIPPSEVSSPGRTISLLVIDEARAVPETVVEVLRPAAAAGRTFTIGSPGSPNGWFWRQATSPGPRDFVRHYTSRFNPQVPEQFVAEERARLERRGDWGRLMFQREWEGQWVALAERPLLSPTDVQAARVESIEPFRRDMDIVAIGVDLSIRRDLTSIVAVGLRGGMLRVLETTVLDPKGKELSLELAEKAILKMALKYSARRVKMDAYQGVLMAQRLRRQGVVVEPVQITPGINREIFEALSESISERRIVWEKHERLESELLNLELAESSTNWKIVDSDKRLHRDVSFSLALAVSLLAPWMSRRTITYAAPTPKRHDVTDLHTAAVMAFDDASGELEALQDEDLAEQHYGRRDFAWSRMTGAPLGGAEAFGRAFMTWPSNSRRQ